MSDNTKIEWAHDTLNLWYGCTQVSPACDHCYAMRTVHRLQLGVKWNAPPVRTPSDWRAKLSKYQRSAPGFLKRRGERRRVFINSMSDFFDNQAPQAWRDEAIAAFLDAPDVDILLVTKRPQNIRKMVPGGWLEEGGWPEHIWLLITAENQVELNRRAFEVMKIDTIPTWGLSSEPLLERIDLTNVKPDITTSVNILTGEAEHLLGDRGKLKHPAKWIIVGYESGGSKARHGDLGWAYTLLDQCAVADTAFFFKQTRNKGPIPDDLMVREFPRHG
jgi:protein gp37